MLGLSDLKAAIVELRQTGTSGRVYFYAPGDRGGALRHGHVRVQDGQTCLIEYARKGNDDAIAEIARMTAFIKIVFMPVDDGVVPTASNPAMPIDVLIACLSPPPEPVPEPRADAASEVIRGMPETVTNPSSDASPGSVLSDSQWQALRQDAVDILGQFYGSAAEKKVMEAAARYSPRENPILFLNACRQQLAMMIGTQKADALLVPLYDRITL